MKKDVFKVTLVSMRDKAIAEVFISDKPEEIAMSLSAMYAHLKKHGMEKVWDMVAKDSERIDIISEIKQIPEDE